MFADVIENYKKMTVKSKRETNIYEIKKLSAILEQLCVENNIPYREIKSKEIIDLKKDDVSEDDYLEAEFVYISYLKEVIGAIVNSKF